MYIPPIFEQKNSSTLIETIKAYPFATLITHSDTGLAANHIPFLFTQAGDKQLLQGNLSKTNPLWQTLQDKSDVLVVFQGPNSYISPNYYPSKQEHGKVVPTWNYVAVHITGNMTYIHDKDWNMAMINRLTTEHEAKQLKPWSAADAPEDFIEKMLSSIVGIEIEISSIIGKWKASQNQPKENKQGVITALSQETDTDSQAMAAIVENCSFKTD